MKQRPKNKFPPLYAPFESWKQAGLAYLLGLVGLSVFYGVRFLLNR